MFVCVLGLASGACSTSMQLDGLFSKKDDAKLADKGDPRDVTGSLPLQPVRVGGRTTGMSAADWTFAGAALREALAVDDGGVSIPWHNPASGARGTVTPISSAFAEEGLTCRNFLASNIGGGQEEWFKGTTCRAPSGQWDVRSTRPLQKS